MLRCDRSCSSASAGSATVRPVALLGAPARVRHRGGHAALRAAVVEEVGVELEHRLTGTAHHQPAVAGELAEVGELDTVRGTPGRQIGEMLGTDGDDHPLLGLAEPDLPRFEPGVLQWHEVEFDVGAHALGHLADRRRQAARTAVGDGGEQVLGADEDVDQQLLDHRVADLHARAGDLAGGGVHRERRERGAPDAVATGAAAEHHHAVAGERAGVQLPAGRLADASGEHERVRGVTRVVQDRPGHGGQADLVAVVGDAVDHALADAQRVQRSLGHVRRPGCREARSTGCR